jgi:hypothetical protein
VRSQETYRSQTSSEATWDCEPVLHILCGRSWASKEAEQVYDDIEANEHVEYYYPNTEFPLFGKRLLELQQFINRHPPRNIGSLLRDRRDVTVWYNVSSHQVSESHQCIHTEHSG